MKLNRLQLQLHHRHAPLLKISGVFIVAILFSIYLFMPSVRVAGNHDISTPQTVTTAVNLLTNGGM